LNPYLVFILAVLLAGWAVERLAALLNVRHATPELPVELEGFYEPARYRRAHEYLRTNSRFGAVVDTAFTFGLIAFILLRGFEWIDVRARALGWSPVPTGLFFAFVLAALLELVGLPVSLWRTFVIEQRFGFNRTTLRTFIADRLKAWTLGALLGGSLGALVLWLFAATGRWAWLWCWGALTAAGAFVTFIAPVWILPLFYELRPLREGELRSAIEALAGRERFALRGIFTVDASRRSSKANAFFTGFGQTRRIVLFDTLVRAHPAEEIVAVLAHELGHSRLRHVPVRLLISCVTTGATLLLISLFINNRQLFDAFSVTHLSIYGSLVFFGFLYQPISTLLGLGGNWLSRRFELAADRFAARAAGGAPLAAALKRLSAENLSNLTPHRLVVFLHHGHPPVLERIRRLERR
jgi:STE24 endopeptidase